MADRPSEIHFWNPDSPLSVRVSPFLSRSVYNIHTHECLEITFGPPQKLAAMFTSEQLVICATVSTSKQMIQWFVFVHGREQGRRENSRNSSLKVQLSAASHTDCMCTWTQVFCPQQWRACVRVCVCVLCTFVAEVVDQDDLGYEVWRRAIQHAVNGPEQRRPALVVERDDDGGVGQLLCIQLVFTATHGRHK